MRNIVEYPVTEDEVIDTLHAARRDHPDQIGSLHPMIFSAIIFYLHDHPAMLAEIVESMRIEND